MTSKRSQLLTNLKSLLTTHCSWAKMISWEKIRVISSDFAEHELPVIQFYHVRTDYEQQQGRALARMQFNIELCLKSTTSGVINQKDLFDKMDLILQAIGTNPNLDISGMIHLRPISDETDIHILEPLFIGVWNFEALYLTTFAGC
jgi:hypothetical protein